MLDSLAAVATVLGFSVLGVLVTAKSIGMYGLRAWFRYQDKKELGAEYEYLEALATREGLYSRTKSIRLSTAIRNETNAAKRALIRGLQEQLEAKLGRVASGSTHLSYHDLLTARDLFLPISFEDSKTHSNLQLAGLISSLPGDGPEFGIRGSRRGTLLISATGTGKSLSCLAIEHHYTKAKYLASGEWVFLLSAQDFWDADALGLGHGTSCGIGSEQWCVQMIVARLGWEQTGELRRRALSRDLRDHGIIVIDGLDEIAARLGRAETEMFLNSWVFERAVLITTRPSFYNASLQGHPALNHHRKMTLAAPTQESRHSFVQQVCGRLYGRDAQARVDAITRILEKYPQVDAIASAPLLLMMLVEIGVVEDPSLTKADSIWLYEEFVRQIIDRDAPRSHSADSPDTMRTLYQELAWALFRTASGSDTPASMIDLTELRQIFTDVEASQPLGNPSALQATLLGSPLITAQRGEGFRGRSIKIGFSHESFLEFHIAQRAYDWLTGRMSRGADFFEYLETPEISAFLKEYLARVARDHRTTRDVVERLKRPLETLLDTREATSDEFTARKHSFMAGQIAYYLGMIVDRSNHHRLYTIATLETDFWIRRSAAIGLAFGGYPDALNELIEEMRQGMDRGDFLLARKNIAIELGFYGDQPFDPRDPTRDLGGHSCERLVTRICREMCTDIEAPYRRMGLFDIVYLSRHRDISKQSFQRTLRCSYDTLQQALDKMEKQIDAAKFPEIPEVRSVLTFVGR